MWSYIKKAINSNLNKALDILISEKTQEIKIDAAANKDAINNKIDPINNKIDATKQQTDTLVNRGAVKRVQSGRVTMYSREGSKTIDISAVNPSKCMVLINGAGYNLGSVAHETGMSTAYLSWLSTASFGIGCDSSGGQVTFTASWQVIEFY